MTDFQRHQRPQGPDQAGNRSVDGAFADDIDVDVEGQLTDFDHPRKTADGWRRGGRQPQAILAPGDAVGGGGHRRESEGATIEIDCRPRRHRHHGHAAVSAGFEAFAGKTQQGAHLWRRTRRIEHKGRIDAQRVFKMPPSPLPLGSFGAAGLCGTSETHEQACTTKSGQLQQFPLLEREVAVGLQLRDRTFKQADGALVLDGAGGFVGRRQRGFDRDQ